ncbi:neuroligin-4, X-linked [Octopus bimaculoides]|uniref:neuroligin-4, X-linked n=1 Tax=Octopus bimaculoides TaxID=37653 RepID=UPI0022E6934E|nr:neuroligin-4, X-linked [Octopus bimaculoides]
MTATGNNFQVFLTSIRTLEKLVFLVQIIIIVISILHIPKTNARINMEDAYEKVISEKIIETKYGKIRGVQFLFRKDLSLRPVDAYLGIPYGSFRKNAMRFMPPGNPPFRWEETSPVLETASVCPQKIMDENTLRDAKLPKSRKEYLRKIRPYLIKQEEDCLKLNVYVPRQGKCIFNSLDFALDCTIPNELKER